MNFDPCKTWKYVKVKQMSVIGECKLYVKKLL